MLDLIRFSGVDPEVSDVSLMPPLLWTTAECACALRVSEDDLDAWRLAGEGPLYVEVASMVRYRPTDVAEWVSSLPTKRQRPDLFSRSRGGS